MSEKTPEFLNFTIKKESWNKYRLEDGAELHTRALLVRPFHTQSKQKPNQKDFGGNSQTIFTVKPLDGYQFFGTPNQNNNPEKIKNSKKTNVDFSQISEDWNVYELEGGKIIKFKLLVGNVKRCENIFDDVGVAVYNIESQIVIHVDENKE